MAVHAGKILNLFNSILNRDNIELILENELNRYE